MKKTYSIALIPGDGTGPEVIAEGCKVLEAAAAKFHFGLHFVRFDFGGERYMKTGELLADSAIQELRGFNAIYLGAIGHTDVKPGILEKGILLKLRFALDQYINLRPIRLYEGVETPIKNMGPAEIDYCVIRENSGDSYVGVGGNMMPGTPDEVAVQSSVYSRRQVDRCLRFAFEYTRTHGKKACGKGERNTLALVGKSNVLTYTFDLWNRAFEEIGAEYPDIVREYYHVDAVTLYQVQCPGMFDVIVTTNLFGDIITDLGAATQGGLGVASGGNINPDGVSMFEPIGGTAPLWTGKNAINPVAAIGSGMLMLEALGETQAAQAVDRAIREVVRTRMKSQLANQMGMTTTEVGDAIAENV
ncbi:MAG: 3-isopropylmalate dehydrogenase [Verrucomicrobiota bacterium]|jgi:3-isopropylmalate dehydrogenase|nr:3-isopropylmalate dehydrogenase [Verrucomicrobiota bacterium]